MGTYLPINIAVATVKAFASEMTRVTVPVNKSSIIDGINNDIYIISFKSSLLNLKLLYRKSSSKLSIRITFLDGRKLGVELSNLMESDIEHNK